MGVFVGFLKLGWSADTSQWLRGGCGEAANTAFFELTHVVGITKGSRLRQNDANAIVRLMKEKNP